MKPFLGDDFLLDSDVAAELYHDVAAPLPIVDYHNHLPAGEIAADRKWDTLGQIWLEADHYKWRAMRWAGIDEVCITGKASDRQKFDAYAAIMPACIGNPLYHWSHLELYRYFKMDGTILSSQSANRVWDEANACLARPEYSARGLLNKMNVAFVGTTDDPCDDLENHLALGRESQLGFKVAPSFRPDRAFKIDLDGFTAYLERLAFVSGQSIDTFDDLLAALISRLDKFVAAGCRATDHGLEVVATGTVRTSAALDGILSKRRAGSVLDEDEVADFQSAVLVQLARAYCERNLVMQFHIGAVRNARSRLFSGVGTDVGGDSIGDRAIATSLNGLLDRMDKTGHLPRTILYALDPSRNEVVVTTAGNFQDGTIAGKIQAGSGWWYNDQYDGMLRQMTQLSQMGLLSRFVGMLTDSRSFLSFPRHEYFRRILCNMVGNWMERGEMPPDMDLARTLVSDVCYNNAKSWFIDP